MVKALESKSNVGLTMAVEIWKGLKVKIYGAGQPKAWEECELSKKTWVNCNSDSDYEDAIGHYQRLNNRVMRHFYEMSKRNVQEYPPLMRRNGKIGKMTDSLAIIEVSRNIRTSATTAVKAMDINRGKDLGIDVPGRLIGDLIGKAKALGFDDKETAKKFIDSQISAIKQISMTPDERSALGKEIAGSLIDSFNTNSQIIHHDQKHQDLVGERDSLSTNNPNVHKADDSSKPVHKDGDSSK